MSLPPKRWDGFWWEGMESVAQGDREQKHPYRMSMVCEKRDGRWLLAQVHGSSPHHG
jgi:SnoaL-like domain